MNGRKNPRFRKEKNLTMRSVIRRKKGEEGK